MDTEKKRKKGFFHIKHWKRVAIYLVAYDLLSVNFAYLFALVLRFDGINNIQERFMTAFLKFAPFYSVFCLIVFFWLQLYNSIWQYASFRELTRITEASVITCVFHVFGITIFFQRMPISYYFMGAVIQFMLMVAIRFSYRFVLLLRSNLNNRGSVENPRSRVMLVGAGSAGQMILRDLNKAQETKDKVCCIIDDDTNKWNRLMEGVPVVGGRDDILLNVEKYHIDKIYVAIPSATAEEKRDILNICKESGCELKNLPGMYQFVTGEISVAAMKDVAVEDLLGREPIKVNLDEIFSMLRGNVILVTGGGGSIGSELCRQIAGHSPGQLIIFDVYENNAYDIEQELRHSFPELNLKVLIGSVRDSRRIEQVFSDYRPDIVFHAAAHKHVPLMEVSPCEAIKNNAFGTYKTAYAAMKYGTKRFVLISTDKAVNPTNVMGASKRLCEMVIQFFDRMVKDGRAGDIPPLYEHAMDTGNVCDGDEMAIKPCTEFVAVRFGNVLGSNGSVIPLFKKQIADGGPVTVTHPDIIRYFMTIPEAVSLVLQAGAYAKGGEIFVLDMGSPVKIDTLARNLIKLSGYKPDVDIKIEYTGLRPGEKLYEEKLMEEEGLKTTPNKLIHIGSPIPVDPESFLCGFKKLMSVAYSNNEDEIRQYIMGMVKTYHIEK